jgi:hypothetical protein
MSTRAQIKVRGSEIMIYKHSDGYPSEVIPTLQKVMKQFLIERGNEPDYALAQIMRAFARRDEKRRVERLKKDDNFSQYYKEHRMTGWGLDTIRHGDIEFLYIVDLEVGVIVINAGFGNDMEEEKIIALRGNE